MNFHNKRPPCQSKAVKCTLNTEKRFSTLREEEKRSPHREKAAAAIALRGAGSAGTATSAAHLGHVRGEEGRLFEGPPYIPTLLSFQCLQYISTCFEHFPEYFLKKYTAFRQLSGIPTMKLRDNLDLIYLKIF